MPSARKKCICQLCTCGRHMCLHRNKDTHLILGDGTLAEVNVSLLEAREKRKKQAKQWDLTDGETHDISTTVDQINAQQVLANARSQAKSVFVEDKGNSQAYVNNSGNRWSAKQVPKRQLIRPPDNLKPEGEADFTTIHQLDYTKKATSEISVPSSVHETAASEFHEESWSQRQIPKTLPIKKPDSLILSGPLSLETTNKSDFTENVFQSKAAEATQGDTTHRPRTSLKLSGEFQSDSSYQRAFTPKHAEGVVKIRKGTSISHLRPEGDMSFDTTSLDYKATASELSKRESENDRSYVLKPKPAKPQSGIKIPEVPLQDETTAVTDYRRWNVGKPERHKPADTLQLGDGTTDVDETSSNLSRKVYANAEAKINDARWHVSRPVVRKPQNNLGPEGNFNFDTTNDIDYPSRRSRYSQSNLETVTERTERDQTDDIPTENQIISNGIDQPTNVIDEQPSKISTQREAEPVNIEDIQPVESTKVPTPPQQITEEQIVPQSTRVHEPVIDDLDVVSQNGEQMEYVTWDQIRPKAIRPHSNLRQEGGMEFNTTNRSAFIQRSSERVKGVRPKTSTKVFEGDFDATTMNQIMFTHDHGERPNPIRPKSNLHVENGQFSSETTNAREYQQWEIKRPSPIVHKPSLMQEGTIDFTTTNKTEFEEKHPEKVYPIRPPTTNRISGDLDLTTTNQIMHSSFPIERVQKIVPQSNLRTSSGIFNSETTNQAQFQEYPIDRPKPIRPVSNLHQEGSMDFTTMNQLQFEEKPFEKVSQFRPQTSSKITGDFDGTTTNQLMFAAQPIQKPQMIKPKGNLEVEKGTFAHDTTNNSEYQHWQTVKSQAVTPRNNLQQNGDMDFTTTNQLQYAAKATERVSQIRPKTNSRVTGEFDGTTTNQMMYQNIPGEKSKAVRPKTNIKLEKGNFRGETTNNREFQTWGYEKPSPIKPHSSIRQEGTMDFTTTNNMQFEGKTAERVAQIRPTTTTKITGDFDGTTMNQMMFQNNPVEKVKGKRPSTNIHLEGGRFEDQTTAKREYQQWEISKPDPIKPTGSLTQEGTMDFTTSNQTEYGEKPIVKSEQIRPHTTSPITGEFDGTTTNQVMYQAQPVDKVHDIKPRDNLRVEGGEFKGETTTSKEYGYKSGGKPDAIIPKSNLMQEGDFDFVTSNQLQYEGKSGEKVSNTRPKTHTKMADGKFYGTTTNQAMYQTPAMETVYTTRPPTNLRVEEGTFQGNTTATDAYQQWRSERPKAFQLASSLKQEGDMNFETTNSRDYREKGFERVQQIRPKTTSKIEGDFDATTTNQAMFHQPEKLDRVKPIRHQNNLQLEPGKFSGETTTNREYKQWVKNGNQIAVPKKKLQAAGIRTQRERPNRRKEILSERTVNIDSNVSEQEAWRLANSQDVSSTNDLNNSEEIQTSRANDDNALLKGETETPAAVMDVIEDSSSKNEATKMQVQSNIVADVGAEKSQDLIDISTMMADYGAKKVTKVKAIKPTENLTSKGDMSFITTQKNDYTQQAMTGERKQVMKSQQNGEGADITRSENNESWRLTNDEADHIADMKRDATSRKMKEIQSREQVMRSQQNGEGAGITRSENDESWRLTNDEADHIADMKRDAASRKMKEIQSREQVMRPQQNGEGADITRSENDESWRLTNDEADHIADMKRDAASRKIKEIQSREQVMRPQQNGEGADITRSKNDQSWRLTNDEADHIADMKRDAASRKIKEIQSREQVMRPQQNGEGADITRSKNDQSWRLTNDETDHIADMKRDAASRKIKEIQSRENINREQESTKKQISSMKISTKPVKSYKPTDNLKIEHVPFDGTSTSRAEYKKWEGRRSSSKKREENLRQEGKMEFDTTSNDYSMTRNYQLTRDTRRSRIKDELKKGSLTPTGSMEFSTTSKSSYMGATTAARAKNLRPRSSLRLGVSDPSNQDVMPSSRSNPEISSTRENYDLTSTSRASYVGYTTGRRTRTNRPSTSQKVGEGAFEGQSTTRSTFTMPQEGVVKSRTMRPENHNILDTSNGFTGNTTYRSSFETVKGHCPVIDLEAGRLPLTFNEEKNGHLFYAPRVQG